MASVVAVRGDLARADRRMNARLGGRTSDRARARQTPEHGRRSVGAFLNIPSETDARSEVVPIALGSPEDKTRWPNGVAFRTIGDAIQGLGVGHVGNAKPFIAETKVQREPRSYLPVILEESEVRGLVTIGLAATSTALGKNRWHLIADELAQVVVLPLSASARQETAGSNPSPILIAPLQAVRTDRVAHLIQDLINVLAAALRRVPFRPQLEVRQAVNKHVGEVGKL